MVYGLLFNRCQPQTVNIKLQIQMKHFLLFVAILFTSILTAQEAYRFTTVTDLETTPVISQGVTGTCWSFSSTSFLESEIIRLTGKNIDLSEMYQVRNTYPLKAENYIMRQGKAQFSEGGLAHDVMNSVMKNGLVPEESFSGLLFGDEKHNHAEMIAVMEAMVKTYVDNPGQNSAQNGELQLMAFWMLILVRMLPISLSKENNIHSRLSWQ